MSRHIAMATCLAKWTLVTQISPCQVLTAEDPVTPLFFLKTQSPLPFFLKTQSHLSFYSTGNSSQFSA